MGNRSTDGSACRRVVVIGPGELPDATQRALQAAAARVIRLAHPSDGDLRQALSEQVDSVVVCSRDDAVALRLALIVEYVRPGIPLIVTVHGRIVSSQLRRAVSNIRVTSMAEIVAPTLAAPCLDDRLLWVGVAPKESLACGPTTPARSWCASRRRAGVAASSCWPELARWCDPSSPAPAS